jgi:hypothetical protein
MRRKSSRALVAGVASVVIAVACSENGTGVPLDPDSGAPFDSGAVDVGIVDDSAAAEDTAVDDPALEDAGFDAPLVCTAPTVVIDQSVADDYTLIPPWQSFEVPETGLLTALELRPNTYSADGGITEMVLSIYTGEGTSGTRLAQEDFTAGSASSAPPRAFSLTTRVLLQAGQKYTWELTGAKGLYYSNTNTYAGGRASDPARDMVFKAHVAPCH